MARKHARRSRRWWWGGAGVAAVLLGYLALCWFVTTRVAPDSEVTVPGGSAVEVSGLAPAQAVATAQRALGARPDSELTLRVATRSASIPATALRVDTAATVQRFVGFTLNPVTVLDRLRGGLSVPLVVHIDDARLRTQLAGVSSATQTAPVDGSVAFVDGVLQRTEPQDGFTVDLPGSVAAIGSVWPGRTDLELPLLAEPPPIDTDDLDAFVRDVATPLTSGPVTITVAEVPVILQPAALTPAVRVAAVDGELVTSFDGPTIAAALLAPGTGVGAAAENARFEIRDNVVTIVPATNGVSIDAQVAAAAVQTAITAADRSARIETTSTQPEITTENLQAAGVTEVVSEFATPLTDNAARTENIMIAATTVNGSYLAPGATFSLNGVLGRRTSDKGYNEAPVISGGRLTMGTGGGVSQVATTLFNGMFFAGLKDVEHKPHSFYISRYPEGREATVNYPSVDLKFTNDSPHGVLIEMWVADGQVHTRFWSTRVWQITAEKSERTNIRAPQTIHDSSAGCVTQSAQSGFDVTVTRIFSQGGSEQRRETFRTRYIPEDRVICG